MTNRDKEQLGMELLSVITEMEEKKARHQREIDDLIQKVKDLADRWAKMRAENCDLKDMTER